MGGVAVEQLVGWFYIRVQFREPQTDEETLPTISDVATLLQGTQALIRLNSYIDAADPSMRFSDADWRSLYSMLGGGGLPDRQQEVLTQAFAALSEQERALLTLLLADEAVSYIEIADRLDIPLGSIGPRRARALSRLRRFMIQIDPTVLEYDEASGPAGPPPKSESREDPTTPTTARPVDVRVLSITRNSPLEFVLVIGAGLTAASASAALIATRVRNIVRRYNEIRVDYARTTTRVTAYEALTDMLEKNRESAAAGGASADLTALDTASLIKALDAVELIDLLGPSPD